jgi:hypothetical protein
LYRRISRLPRAKLDRKERNVGSTVNDSSVMGDEPLSAVLKIKCRKIIIFLPAVLDDWESKRFTFL